MSNYMSHKKVLCATLLHTAAATRHFMHILLGIIINLLVGAKTNTFIRKPSKPSWIRLRHVKGEKKQFFLFQLNLICNKIIWYLCNVMRIYLFRQVIIMYIFNICTGERITDGWHFFLERIMCVWLKKQGSKELKLVITRQERWQRTQYNVFIQLNVLKYIQDYKELRRAHGPGRVFSILRVEARFGLCKRSGLHVFLGMNKAWALHFERQILPVRTETVPHANTS